jgi:hypothetical protein
MLPAMTGFGKTADFPVNPVLYGSLRLGCFQTRLWLKMPSSRLTISMTAPAAIDHSGFSYCGCLPWFFAKAAVRAPRQCRHK